MANEFRVRKKLIVNGSGSTILDVQGSQGQLFSVTDSLSGSLFSVKDISGIPVIEAFSDDTVNIGTFNAEAIKVSGSFARITGSLFGTASFANNVVSSSYAATASVLLGSVVSASYADSASVAVSSSYAATASYVLGGASTITIQDEGSPQGSAGTINFVGAGVTATVGGGTATVTIPGAGGTTFPYTGSAIISGSLIVTGSVSATQGGFTGSLLGTASWAENAVTASYVQLAQTASYVIQAQTSSYVNPLVQDVQITGSVDVKFGNVNIRSNANFFQGTAINGTSNVSLIGVDSNNVIRIGNQGYNNVIEDDTDIWGGLTVSGSSLISGSLLVTNGITGSLYGTASWALNAITASYANNIIISGSINNVDYIDFNNTLTPLPATVEGRIFWDEDNGTLSLGMHSGQVLQQIGLEEYFYIKNQTGATLTNGAVIRSAGTLGSSGRILGDYMIADGTIPYYYTLGIATEDIIDGDDGYVTQFGAVRGVNTTGTSVGETWIDGDILWVSTTVLGGLTKVEPDSPNLKIQMAIVIKADANGTLFVRPNLGAFLTDLHNVNDFSTTSSYGDLLIKSGSTWFNSKQLTGSYGLTGSLRATTINATYLTASGNNYPTNPGTSSYFLQTDGVGNLSWNYVRSVLESVKLP
jgi:hypothetical protein